MRRSLIPFPRNPAGHHFGGRLHQNMTSMSDQLPPFNDSAADTNIKPGIPPSPTPMPRSGEPIAYQPVSGWAVAGFATSGFFALLVGISTIVAPLSEVPRSSFPSGSSASPWSALSFPSLAKIRFRIPKAPAPALASPAWAFGSASSADYAISPTTTPPATPKKPRPTAFS